MRTDPNIPDPDQFFERWVRAHQGMSAADSFALNARLVLLLANQIGDARVLEQCIDAAAAPYRDPRQDGRSRGRQ
ncbi:MAG: DUF2783 domain-containing protein [Burkholderiales bacterium]|nr:MAG: DUF2783 domain-containing protein [Burkholderiales bacterium]